MIVAGEKKYDILSKVVLEKRLEQNKGGKPMKVKVIMIPRNKTKCIKADDTIEQALALIDENGLLSLPVVDGNKIFGILSKRYVYEAYFKEENVDRQEFLSRPVRSFIQTKLTTVDENAQIEEAAELFIGSKAPFIPVLDEKEELAGIVTYQAIFKEYQKISGTNKYHTLVIWVYDFKGKLAEITEMIARYDGNIKNVRQRDTDLFGVQEVTFKIECPNLDKLANALKKKDFDVRKVIPAGGIPTKSK